MEHHDILLQATEVFRKVFEKDNIVIAMETTADDIDEWNSLNHTILISEIEKHFKVRFKLKEVLSFKSVGDMVNTIHEKLKGI